MSTSWRVRWFSRKYKRSFEESFWASQDGSSARERFYAIRNSKRPVVWVVLEQVNTNDETGGQSVSLVFRYPIDPRSTLPGSTQAERERSATHLLCVERCGPGCDA